MITLSVEQDVDPNSELELRFVLNSNLPFIASFYLHDFRLFGAQCYSDFENPGKCL